VVLTDQVTYLKGEVMMKMQEPVMNEAPGRGVIRRVGTAVVALLALLVLAGCHEARGWGSIGTPADGAVPVVTPNGKGQFAFRYHCNPKKVRGRVYTYRDTSTNGPYPRLWIEGVVTRTFVDPDGDGPADFRPARSCQDLVEAPAAQFAGTYRSLEKKYCKARGGRFTILVYDQGNPSLPEGEFTGDGFSIELFGGPYTGYTRAGYIEKGDIYAN